MLEARVGRLEEDLRDVRATLARLEPMLIELLHTAAKKSDLERIEARLAETREEVKEMKGALSRSPTINHLLAATISTWIAGAGIVFALMRLPAP
jgi:DNA-binding GntR family transcriptional regulator